MAGVRVEVAQERELRVLPIRIGDVADQQFHHAAPLGVGGPGRIAAGDFRRRPEEIAVVEVVVVQFHVGAVGGRVADQRAPAVVVIKQAAVLRLAVRRRRREPLLQPLPQPLVQRLGGVVLSVLLRDGDERGDLSHPFAVRIGVGDPRRLRVHFFLQVGGDLVLVRPADVRQRRQDAGETHRRAERRSLGQLHLAAHRRVLANEMQVAGVAPLVRVEREQRAVHVAFLRRRAEGERRRHRAGLRLVGPLHPRVGDVRVSVSLEEGERLRGLVGQQRQREIVFGVGMVRQHLAREAGPGGAGRPEQAVRLAVDRNAERRGCSRRRTRRAAPAGRSRAGSPPS